MEIEAVRAMNIEVDGPRRCWTMGFSPCDLIGMIGMIGRIAIPIAEDGHGPAVRLIRARNHIKCRVSGCGSAFSQLANLKIHEWHHQE